MVLVPSLAPFPVALFPKNRPRRWSQVEFDLAGLEFRDPPDFCLPFCSREVRALSLSLDNLLILTLFCFSRTFSLRDRSIFVGSFTLPLPRLAEPTMIVLYPLSHRVLPLVIETLFTHDDPFWSSV